MIDSKKYYIIFATSVIALVIAIGVAIFGGKSEKVIERIIPGIVGGSTGYDSIEFQFDSNDPSLSTGASELNLDGIKLSLASASGTAYWRNNTGSRKYVVSPLLRTTGTASSTYVIDLFATSSLVTLRSNATGNHYAANVGTSSIARWIVPTSTRSQTFDPNSFATSSENDDGFVDGTYENRAQKGVWIDPLQWLVLKITAGTSTLGVIDGSAATLSTTGQHGTACSGGSAQGAAGTCESATSTLRGFNVEARVLLTE